MEETFFELLRYSIGASDKMRHLSDEETESRREIGVVKIDREIVGETEYHASQ